MSIDCLHQGSMYFAREERLGRMRRTTDERFTTYSGHCFPKFFMAYAYHGA